jgi:hypothetical protein
MVTVHPRIDFRDWIAQAYHASIVGLITNGENAAERPDNLGAGKDHKFDVTSSTAIF